ncbi:MAG: cation diffusion facilitator family transporter [Bacteroidia bacterium]|nr:cation diffusion facilitator family transporter [Bacteroidia bacterium]
MNKSTFHIAKMDCSAEEQMIRMQLEPFEEVEHLDFDLPNRKLVVYHLGEIKPIYTAIHQLNLNDRLLKTIQTEETLPKQENHERTILWWVLGINFGFFLLEMTYGWLANSMGLIADSLDMLADAIVYALSLLAVGAAVSRKKKVAGISGYFQMALAVLGFFEVIRRFVGYGEIPVFQTMIIVSALALVGNGISLYLIYKAKSEDAHMKASWIFTSNDIIVNLGVIVAGVLVYATNSRYPDLIIGSIVFLVVIRGAIRILKLSKS